MCKFGTYYGRCVQYLTMCTTTEKKSVVVVDDDFYGGYGAEVISVTEGGRKKEKKTHAGAGRHYQANEMKPSYYIK